MDIKNLSTIRQTFANVVFTHKIQEIAAENQEKKSLYVNLTNILLVSATLILFFLQTSFPTNIIYSYLGTGITIGEIIFLIVQLSFSFEQKVVMHKNAALKYMELRDCYRVLITDIMNETLSKDELSIKRDYLQQLYQIISELSPQTGKIEYKEAQKRLNKRGEIEGEEFTWSDEEIDKFLPEKLRFKKNS